MEPALAIDLVGRLSGQLSSFLDEMDTLVAAGVLRRGEDEFAVVGTNRRELLPDGERYRVWHAEQEVLANFADVADGTPVTVVVTLEPCGSRTRGPPEDRVACSQRIIDFSRNVCPVERVVAGFFDGGGGLEQLVQHGIPVTLLHGVAHGAHLPDEDPTAVVAAVNSRGHAAMAEVVAAPAVDELNWERLERESRRASDCRAELGQVLTVLLEEERQGRDGATAVAGGFHGLMRTKDVEKLRERLSPWRRRGGPLTEAIVRLIRGCVDRQWEERQRAAILKALREQRRDV